MRTKIIAAFPGTGKSTYHRKHPYTTIDFKEKILLDPENFKKISDTEFLVDLINRIKENIGKYEYIFIPYHEEVISALLDNCIFFYLVYPDSNRKKEFIQRFIDRENSEEFIKLVSDNWDEMITQCNWVGDGAKRICMVLPNLEDELNHMSRTEIIL